MDVEVQEDFSKYRWTIQPESPDQLASHGRDGNHDVETSDRVVDNTDIGIFHAEERFFAPLTSSLDVNMTPSLCPWCDEVLPAAPSPHLLKLISYTSRRSYRDPRPCNPSGLTAPVSLFTLVCHRHDLEQNQIPRAEEHGWPRQIDWDSLEDRVTALQPSLRMIVDDVPEDSEVTVDDGDESETEDESFRLMHPRMGSVFWKGILRDIKKYGSRRMAGTQGQLINFAKTQPG